MVMGLETFRAIASDSLFPNVQLLVPDPDSSPAGILSDAFTAANKGDWARFINAMRGPYLRAQDALITFARAWADTPGRYGNRPAEIGVGDRAPSVVLPRREHERRIVKDERPPASGSGRRSIQGQEFQAP